MATPNIKSWEHRYFGEKWVGLNPPRHLMLFSWRNLAQCAERACLRIENLRTSSRSASFCLELESFNQKTRRPARRAGYSLEKIRSKLAGVVFQALEHSLRARMRGKKSCSSLGGIDGTPAVFFLANDSGTPLVGRALFGSHRLWQSGIFLEFDLSVSARPVLGHGK